jgi:hypothetical protein
MSSVSQQIIALLESSSGLTDREIAERLLGKGAAQQPINQAARMLERQGAIQRKKRPDGLIGNYFINSPLPVSATAPKNISTSQLETDVTKDWFWEGNVVDCLAQFLVTKDWQIVSKANTHSKERGVDIHAAKSKTVLLIEAKGFPSTSYRDPKRSSEAKPTNPNNQAQQWYSHALLKVMRLQTEYPQAIVALGLPDFPRYRKLFEETQTGLQKLGIVLLATSEDGDVSEWGTSKKIIL